MSLIPFTRFGPDQTRPRIRLPGNRVLIMPAGGTYTAEWEPELQKAMTDTRRDESKTLGYRFKATLAWKFAPDTEIQNPAGSASTVSGVEAMALVLGGDELEFSLSGNPPWIDVRPTNSFKWRNDRTNKPQGGTVVLESRDLFADFLGVEGAWMSY